LTSPRGAEDFKAKRLGTAGLFSPNPSAMNMFSMNMGPAVIDLLDPHFDMTDGLAQKQSALRGKRGSLNLPQSQTFDP
jgi:hypothetical protein